MEEYVNDLNSECAIYLQQRTEERAAKAKADDAKAKILALVAQHGQVPPNAEKSRRVETALYVATVTTGTSVEINDNKVTELELLLSRARCPSTFALLFERRTEYTLAKTAADAMKTTRWPKRWAAQITALYATCFTPRSRTPSLDVDTREAVAERERQAAEKSASKLRAGKAAK